MSADSAPTPAALVLQERIDNALAHLRRVRSINDLTYAATLSEEILHVLDADTINHSADTIAAELGVAIEHLKGVRDSQD